jgi:translation initiation factor IF-3
MPVDEALAAAMERGLDLVEVAPTARPPVVKIMNYGKFKFEEAKAASTSRPATRGSSSETGTK